MFRRRWCWRWNHHFVGVDPLQRCPGVYCVGKANECLLYHDILHEYHNACWNGWLFFCPMKIHDSTKCIVQSFNLIFCSCTITIHPALTVSHKFTLRCCNSGTILHPHPNPSTRVDNTNNTSTLVITPLLQIKTVPSTRIHYSEFFKFNVLLVGHTKPTTDCRLSFAFANKGNVAAGDNQSLVNTHTIAWTPSSSRIFSGSFPMYSFLSEKTFANAIAFSKMGHPCGTTITFCVITCCQYSKNWRLRRKIDYFQFRNLLCGKCVPSRPWQGLHMDASGRR